MPPSSSPAAPERSAAPADHSLVLLLCGNVLFAAGLVVHAFLFNFYLRELQLPARVMGHQVAAMTLGGLIALIPAGLLIDRWGTRRTLLAGVGATVVGLTLTALARATVPIVAAAVVIGIGAASCRVAWGPVIMTLTGPANRSRAFAGNVALLIGSGAAWTFGAGWIRDRIPSALGLTSTQLTLIGAAAVTALAAACYATLPVPRMERPARARTQDFAPPVEGGVRVVIPLIAFWMLAAALVLPFFNIYFTDRYALRVSQVGALFATAQIFTAVVLVGTGELARRRGVRTMLFAWMTLLAPALLLLSFEPPLWVAIGAFVVQGIVAPATNPLIDQLLLEHAPRERHGIVAAWRNAAAESAGALGASAGGSMLTMSSYMSLMRIAATVAAIAGVALYAAFRRSDALPADVVASHDGTIAT